MNLPACDRDIWLIGGECTPDEIVRLKMDPREVLRGSVDPWYHVWLKKCLVVSDPEWIFTSSKASLRDEKVELAYARLRERYLLKVIRFLSRGMMALKRGSMSSTGLWTLCAASCLLSSVAIANRSPVGGTHLWRLIRDGGLLDTKHINAVSWALGLELATENSATRRMDALALLLRSSRESGRLDGVQRRTNYLIRSGRVVEAYSLLGIEIASATDLLLSASTKIVDARPEDAADILCSALGVDAESGKLFFRALNIDVDRKESADALEALSEFVSLQARRRE